MFIAVSLFGDNEHYFRFKFDKSYDMKKISRIISIDNLKDGYVYAYSNDKELDDFKILGIEIEKLINPSLQCEDIIMVDSAIKLRKNEWNAYPTYEAYVEMMNTFANDYKDYCELINIGKTVKERDLLVLKITAPNSSNKPSVLLTSSMHGDETTGYVLMLRLIDHLLTQYGIDDEITQILDNTVIYINPLHNPDGTYKSGNTTVNGATRYNANYVDLNRNFPDPFGNEYPTGAWQPETVAFMDFSKNYKTTMSMNLHGGIELVNYPWDSKRERHADDVWFVNISRQFATLAQENSPSQYYFTGENNGITNGYDWYYTSGSRQDYVVYYASGREFTAEISTTKLVQASQLPNYWTYLNKSFICFLKQANNGIKGSIVNILNDTPIKDAKIFVKNRDKDNSHVYSNDAGWFFRVIEKGTYSLEITADGYETVVVDNVVVDENGAMTLVDIKMKPEGLEIVDNPTILTDGLKDLNGIYIGKANIDFVCKTVDANVFYSLDGINFHKYSGISIVIDSSKTLSFYAAKDGMMNSDVITNYIGIIAPYSENVPYYTDSSFSHWGVYSINGDTEWIVNASSGYISFNENGIDIQNNECWLISPKFNGITKGLLSFDIELEDMSDSFSVFISSNYDGKSNPNEEIFDWLRYEQPLFNDKFNKVELPMIIDGTTCHIAFVYNNQDESSFSCKLKDICIRDTSSCSEVGDINNLNVYFSESILVFSQTVSSDIFIRDIAGRVVEKGTIELDNKYSLNNTLETGVYLISVYFNGEKVNKKIFYRKGNL